MPGHLLHALNVAFRPPNTETVALDVKMLHGKLLIINVLSFVLNKRLGAQMWKNQDFSQFLLIPYTWVKERWLIDLNVKGEAVDLPEANVQNIFTTLCQTKPSPPQHAWHFGADDSLLWGMSWAWQAWRHPWPSCESQKCLYPPRRRPLLVESPWVRQRIR